MIISAATLPGHPAQANEDWYITTPGLIVVLDGATIRTSTAGVGLVQFDQDTVRCLVLGDVSVNVETGTGIEVLSDDRVSHTAAELRREADRHPSAPTSNAARCSR